MVLATTVDADIDDVAAHKSKVGLEDVAVFIALPQSGIQDVSTKVYPVSQEV